ncbi:MAG: DNA adenine methylase [Bacteroidota bacterium]
MVKYIGSKRKLVPLIQSVIGTLSGVREVVDLFSGTSRVGHGLKSLGYAVNANDINRYAHVLATCYVQADREEVERNARSLLQRYSRLPGREGYFTGTFCRESRFFQPRNGARVDAIRDAIAADDLDPELEAVVLTSLMEAADRVDSTTGVQMAYLKKWAPRASNDLELRMPAVLPQATHGKGQAYQMDALEAAPRLTGDVAYLDPPYNQHKYLGNYHIWETLARWDAPEPYGVARKRVDCRERKSPFNSKPRIHAAMRRVVEALDVRHLVVSFSDEGYISKNEMVEILSARGNVHVLAREYDRYVGAQIGIHNLDGERVGEVSHLTNTEYIYVVPEKGTDFKMAHHAPVAIPSASSQTPQLQPVSERTASRPARALDDALLDLLSSHGSLTNRVARQALGTDSAETRASFKRLIESGNAYKTGRRRGTVYHLSRPRDSDAVPSTPDGRSSLSAEESQLSMFS